MSRAQCFFLGLYVFLLLLCVCLMVVSDSLSPTVRASLLPVSSDGFKTTLGALLGALSVLLGKE
jgi:hypothetical protein